jgi:hypothetical protein
MRAQKCAACFWDGLEGNVEHGGIPALLRESHAPGIGHVQAYYSSVPVNEKLKACVNFIDLSDQL